MPPLAFQHLCPSKVSQLSTCARHKCPNQPRASHEPAPTGLSALVPVTSVPTPHLCPSQVSQTARSVPGAWPPWARSRCPRHSPTHLCPTHLSNQERPRNLSLRVALRCAPLVPRSVKLFRSAVLGPCFVFDWPAALRASRSGFEMV